MTETDVFQAAAVLSPPDLTDPRADEFYRAGARRKVVEALVGKLAGGGRFVIRLVETEERDAHFYDRAAYRVQAEITPVEYQQVRMPVIPDYPAMAAWPLSVTACGEIRRRVKGWLRYFTGRIA